MKDKEDKIFNMASCMLSILDSLKLFDNDSLYMEDETLSEMMFRKMSAYDIDLNKELGFTHLEPVKKKNYYLIGNSIVEKIITTNNINIEEELENSKNDVDKNDVDNFYQHISTLFLNVILNRLDEFNNKENVKDKAIKCRKQIRKILEKRNK